MSITDLHADAPIASIEWPTLALAALIYASWLALTWFHAEIVWWLFLPLAAWISAWFGSLQHEIIHGHPTRHAALNTALASPPLWLWLPFARYRDTHLIHHRDDRLTDPIDDPESRYVTAETWRALGPLARLIIRSQATLLGRMTLGPSWTILNFLRAELCAIARGDAALLRIWVLHALALVPILFWIFWICDMPAWLYLLGVVQGGLALTLIRSFAEHRAAGPVRQRIAMVENSRVLGPLFLFNNLHAAHHRWPQAPWYRLPALHRAHRAALIAENGNLVYAGYADLFRRFLLSAHDTPVHPLDRAP